MTNRPVNANDPTGDVEACDRDDWACQYHWDQPITYDDSYYENKNVMKRIGNDLDSLRDVWTTLTNPLSDFGVGDVVEPAVNLGCEYYKKVPCPQTAWSAGKWADAVFDVVVALFNPENNGDGPPMLNPIPQTPTSSPPWATWTPDPSPTGITPRPSRPPFTSTSTPTLFSPTPSLTSTQQPTWTPTTSSTPPYITPTYNHP